MSRPSRSSSRGKCDAVPKGQVPEAEPDLARAGAAHATQCWWRLTNVWRRVTSHVPGARRLRSGENLPRAVGVTQHGSLKEPAVLGRMALYELLTSATLNAPSPQARQHAQNIRIAPQRGGPRIEPRRLPLPARLAGRSRWPRRSSASPVGASTTELLCQSQTALWSPRSRPAPSRCAPFA